MYKAIFTHSMLTLALCALLPACVVPTDPDAGDELERIGETGAPAEAEEEMAAQEPDGDAHDTLRPALDGDLHEGPLDAQEAASAEHADASEKGDGTSDVITGSQWTSPYRGGYGGSPFWMGCAAGEVATGIYGRSGTKIDQLGLVCTYINPDNSFGAVSYRGAIGGSGGSYFISTCPTNHAIAGLEGRSAALIDRLSILCDTIPGTWIMYSGPGYGGWGGSSFSYTAPRAYFLTTLQGGSGSVIDGFRAIFSYIAP